MLGLALALFIYGCSETDEADQTINGPAPTLTATATVDPVNPQLYNFTSETQNSLKLQWTIIPNGVGIFRGGTNNTSANPSFEFTRGGTFVVRVTSTGTSGITSQDFTLTVPPPPPPPPPPTTAELIAGTDPAGSKSWRLPVFTSDPDGPLFLTDEFGNVLLRIRPLDCDEEDRYTFFRNGNYTVQNTNGENTRPDLSFTCGPCTAANCGSTSVNFTGNWSLTPLGPDLFIDLTNDAYIGFVGNTGSRYTIISVTANQLRLRVDAINGRRAWLTLVPA